MRNNLFLVIICFTATFYIACKPPFHHLSKEISKNYNHEMDRKYDLEHNHPLRIFLEKKGFFSNYKVQTDTLIFVQYVSRHIGDVSVAFILNGEKKFPFNDTNQFGETDENVLSAKFLDAVTKWDTTYLNSIPEESSFHKAIIFIARIAKGKITVLAPRSYKIID